METARKPLSPKVAASIAAAVTTLLVCIALLGLHQTQRSADRVAQARYTHVTLDRSTARLTMGAVARRGVCRVDLIAHRCQRHGSCEPVPLVGADAQGGDEVRVVVKIHRAALLRPNPALPWPLTTVLGDAPFAEAVNLAERVKVVERIPPLANRPAPAAPASTELVGEIVLLVQVVLAILLLVRLCDGLATS